MKKFIIPFMFFVALLAQSCGPTKAEQEARAKFIADSTRIADSIIAVKSAIAWGDVMFGMSKDQVLQTQAFRGAKIEKGQNESEIWINMSKENVDIINKGFCSDDIKHIIWTISALLKEDEVCQIFISGDWCMGKNALAESLRGAEYLYKGFVKTIGKAEYYSPNIKSYELKNRPIYAKFGIGNKIVKINIEPYGADGVRNKTIIFNTDFPKKLHQETEIEKLEREAREKAKIEAGKISF